MKISAILFACIAGVASTAWASQPPANLDEILGGKMQGGAQKRSFSAFREAGIAYGSCSGMLRRQHEIAQILKQSVHDLDAIYNFAALSIRADTPGYPVCPSGECKVNETQGYIIPPVLIEIRGVYDQKDERLIRAFDTVYRIHKQAHFSSTPASWRQYLLPNLAVFTDCKMPPVKPDNDEEKAAWNAGIKMGWEKGYAQADRILDDNFGRLKRDFEGMVRYHKLLRLGMVSRPLSSSAELGITGDGKTTMNVNEVIYRITSMPEFTMEREKWK